MYLGFMKQGVSLMGAFFATIALGAWLNFGPLLFLLPIIWFYGFFHAHNLHHAPDEVFRNMPDRFLFGLEDFDNLPVFLRKYRTWIAVLLILIGVGALWNTLLDTLYFLLPDGFYQFYYRIANLLPRLVAGALIILLGLHLIRGKKDSLFPSSPKRPYVEVNRAEPQPPVWTANSGSVGDSHKTEPFSEEKHSENRPEENPDGKTNDSGSRPNGQNFI